MTVTVRHCSSPFVTVCRRSSQWRTSNPSPLGLPASGFSLAFVSQKAWFDEFFIEPTVAFSVGANAVLLTITCSAPRRRSDAKRGRGEQQQRGHGGVAAWSPWLRRRASRGRSGRRVAVATATTTARARCVWQPSSCGRKRPALCSRLEVRSNSHLGARLAVGVEEAERVAALIVIIVIARTESDSTRRQRVATS